MDPDILIQVALDVVFGMDYHNLKSFAETSVGQAWPPVNGGFASC